MSRALSFLGMRPLDVGVIIAYFAAVIVFGLVLAGRQRDASDYFLGHRGLPWWALMMSVVATETSALTVISIPGIAARGDLTWLQVTFGYLVGRIGVAHFLLPGYFDGSQDTAYQRLERRFGVAARRTASGVFLFTRSVADGVRMFATAITLAIITHWSLSLGILAIGLVTLLYTWVGGLRAVVWVDVVQLGVYLLGGIATLIVATHMAGGIDAFGRAWEAGKLRAFDFQLSFKVLYTFWGGLVGGILAAAMSSHASAVNSLASASTHDFYAPMTGRHDPERLLRVGRWLTLIWTAVLVAGALAFRDQNTPVVQLALSIASLTYGSLLGTYILGGISRRTRQVDVIIALVVSITVMSPVVLGAVIPHFPVHWLPGLAWPWYVPLGTTVTVVVGMISSLIGRSVGRPEIPT